MLPPHCGCFHSTDPRSLHQISSVQARFLHTTHKAPPADAFANHINSFKNTHSYFLYHRNHGFPRPSRRQSLCQQPWRKAYPRANRPDAATASYRCRKERNDSPRVCRETQGASDGTAATGNGPASCPTRTSTASTYPTRSSKARSPCGRKLLEEPGSEAENLYLERPA